jgi:hypothetical protein
MPTQVGIHDFVVVRCKVVDADPRRHDGMVTVGKSDIMLLGIGYPP